MSWKHCTARSISLTSNFGLVCKFRAVCSSQRSRGAEAHQAAKADRHQRHRLAATTLCARMEPKPPPSPATALAGLALAREEAVFDLHADLCSGQLSLATAFRQLGLGFDPKVSDAAIAYATQSVDSFVDLFNACVSMQESMPAATPKTKAIRRADGVRLNTVYSGAEPDDLEHERFSSARAGVGDLAPDSPGGRSASSGGFRRPSGDSVGRERRRTRELNLQASAPDESRERRRSKLQSIGEAPDAQASGWGSSSRAEAAASEAARDEWAPTLRPQGAFEQRLQQLERLPNRVQRASRKPSSQRAVSLSKEMQQQAVLPQAVVGTYSCHGLDSNHAKINQDAACICYPPAGGPSGAQTDTALFLVVDGCVGPGLRAADHTRPSPLHHRSLQPPAGPVCPA